MQTERELEILKLRDELNAKLHILRGKEIMLCGSCYHLDEGNWEEHKKNSPNCHRTDYPCRLRVHERDVTFEGSGRANIKWVGVTHG